MKKLNLLKVALATTPIIASLPAITSCSAEQVHIDTNQRKQFCHSKNVSISFELTRFTISDVKVSLLNEETKKISIVQDSIDTFITTGRIDLVIDESVVQNTMFTFSIQFDITRYGKTENIVVDGFEIYYYPQQEDQDDKILIDQKAIERVNSWVFNYSILFSALPKSNVEVTLNDKTGLLSLDKKLYTVESTGVSNLLSIPVNLSFGVSENKFIDFSLELSFTNSFGNPQTINVTDLGASFLREHVKDIPEEYLDIEQQETSNGIEYICKGFKNAVSEELIHEYSELRIPTTVTRILSGAFNNKTKCNKIRSITFEASIQNVEETAFVGCANVVDIDLSLLSLNTIKSWKNIFAGSELQSQYGYVWINDDWYDDKVYEHRSEIQKVLPNIGLNESWRAYFKKDILTDNVFVLEDDAETGGKLLKGMKTAIWSNVDTQHRALVVKIPDGVTKIAPYALSPLGNECAYLNPVASSLAMPIERALILNEQLLELPNECFKRTCIGGSINIPKNIKTIGDNCFEQMQCDSKGNPIVHDDSNPEFKGIVDMHDASSLVSIGKQAFIGANVLKVYIGSKVTSIGESAFENCTSMTHFAFLSAVTQSMSTPFGINMLKGTTSLIDLNFIVFTQAPSWSKQPMGIFTEAGKPQSGDEKNYVQLLPTIPLEEKYVFMIGLYNNNGLPSEWWVLKE